MPMAATQPTPVSRSEVPVAQQGEPVTRRGEPLKGQGEPVTRQRAPSRSGQPGTIRLAALEGEGVL